jgi:hypothetical protein
MAINRTSIAHLNNYPDFGALLPFVNRTSDLLPTDMAEVLGVISVVVRETKGFAQGLALFLCGTATWLLVGLS